MAITLRLLPLLLLAASQEDARITAEPLADGRVAFRLEDSKGQRRACIHNLLVFDNAGHTLVWSAGVDDRSRCQSELVSPTAPPGYSAEGPGRFEPGRTYSVQAYGPGYNTTQSFTIRRPITSN